jgi:hypothetical protein
MPKPAFSAETFRVPALIAAAAGLIVVAGVALIKADEHMGTAHVAGEQVAQQARERARQRRLHRSARLRSDAGRQAGGSTQAPGQA